MTIKLEQIGVISNNIEQKKDAINGTPVLDIKPYYPMYDCKENATVPEWVIRLMDDYF